MPLAFAGKAGRPLMFPNICIRKPGDLPAQRGDVRTGYFRDRLVLAVGQNLLWNHPGIVLDNKAIQGPTYGYHFARLHHLPPQRRGSG